MAADNVAKLTWNPNPEPDLAGYKVYYGRQYNSGGNPLAGIIWSGSINVGNVTTYTVSSVFNADGIWVFAVTPYDTTGNEGTFNLTRTKRIIRTQSYLIRRR